MRSRSFVPLVVLPVLLLSLAAPTESAAAIPRAERRALVDLYFANGGESWSDPAGWLGPYGTECFWRGVVCDGAVTHVEGLDMSSFGLTGSLPPSIGDLTRLRFLELSFNHLTGIPAAVERLLRLETLNVIDNELTALPPELGGLPRLWLVAAGHNRLTRLPPELLSAPLTWLSLEGNRLTEIPAAIGDLRTLEVLVLAGNLLELLPPEIGGLERLMELDLRNNLLTALPPELWRCRSLDRLFLGNNRLTGLPPGFGTLPLTVLEVPDNPLSAVPVEIAELQQLAYLDLGAGPWALAGRALGKGASSFEVTGLAPRTAYWFLVRTVTEAHASNASRVVSRPSARVRGRTLP